MKVLVDTDLLGLLPVPPISDPLEPDEHPWAPPTEDDEASARASTGEEPRFYRDPAPRYRARCRWRPWMPTRNGSRGAFDPWRCAGWSISAD